MKTRFSSLLISGLVMLLLTACGGGNGNNLADPTPQPEAFTALTQTMMTDEEDALPREIADMELQFDANDDPAAFDAFLP